MLHFALITPENQPPEGELLIAYGCGFVAFAHFIKGFWFFYDREAPFRDHTLAVSIKQLGRRARLSAKNITHFTSAKAVGIDPKQSSTIRSGPAIDLHKEDE